MVSTVTYSILTDVSFYSSFLLKGVAFEIRKYFLIKRHLKKNPIIGTFRAPFPDALSAIYPHLDSCCKSF